MFWTFFHLTLNRVIEIFFNYVSRTAAPAKSSTIKNILIGKPTKKTTTTTEEPEVEYEYEDDDEIVEDEEEEQAKPQSNSGAGAQFKDALEEEDPEVIKELITLIKRVGGLDELEKQLQLRLELSEKSSVVTSGKTTTMSPISQSLYNKVINTRRGPSQSRNTSQVTIKSSSDIGSETADSESSVQRQNKENRYSSIVRNSRPRPQNDGLDQLSEVEGGGISTHERPHYVTITRTQAPRTSSTAADEENEEDAIGANEDEEEEEIDEQKAKTTQQLSTHQYVNIRRTRPTTTSTPESSEEVSANVQEVFEEVKNQRISIANDKASPKLSTRMPYVSIRRQRPSTAEPTPFVEDVTPDNR